MNATYLPRPFISKWSTFRSLLRLHQQEETIQSVGKLLANPRLKWLPPIPTNWARHRPTQLEYTVAAALGYLRRKCCANRRPTLTNGPCSNINGFVRSNQPLTLKSGPMKQQMPRSIKRCFTCSLIPSKVQLST